jgi:PAS domain S-box-containing protein
MLWKNGGGNVHADARTKQLGRGMLIFAVLVVLLVDGSARAEPPEPAWRDVVAAVPRDWPPDYSLSARGAPRGFAVDVFNAVADLAHLHVTYIVTDTFGEAFKLVRSGRADLIPTVAVSQERAADFLFSDPVETQVVSLFVRSDANIHGQAQLHGRALGVVGDKPGAQLTARLGGLNVRRFPDARGALFALLAGDIDALAYPNPVLLKLARDAGVGGRIRAVGPPLFELKRAVAIRHDEPELLARVNPAVRAVVDSPSYQSMYVKWYGEKPPFWTVHRVTLAMGVLLAIALATMIAWRYASMMRVNLRLRRNIEARERAERARRQSETSYQLLMEQASDGIVVCAPDGRWVDVNPRVCDMLGYTRDEFLNLNARDLLAEQLEAELPWLARAREGKTLLTECLLKAKDGRPLEVELSSTQLEDGRVQAILRDVTERKRAEAKLRARDDQQRQAQKLEAIGRLAGGVAHDFNNLLTVIAGNTELLSREFGVRGLFHDEVEGIRQAADRAAALTRQLLTFSRQQILQLQVLDLREVVANLEKMLRRVIGEDVELITVSDDDLGRVRADRGRMEQLVMNLVVNARDAMPHGGQLVLRTANAEIDAANPAGRYVLLEVSDSGVGMDAATQSRIFEPFFTTKGKAGTGLGLSTVYGIVQQSGGRIDVESAPGRGTTFRVHLPRVEAKAQTSTPAPRQRPERGRETILLVEDEPLVRQVMARILRSQGYHVIEARSAEEALEKAHHHPEGIDLLLTDVVMPGGTGKELAAELHRERPDLKVLFVSGYTNEVLAADELKPGLSAFLAKPFTPEALGLALRTLLDERWSPEAVEAIRAP